MATIERHHRRSIRLRRYDYTQAGAYYITICAADRSHLFGEVVNTVLEPTAAGTIVRQCWNAIPQHMPTVELDEFIVMPNHVHGIIVITDRTGDADGVVGAGNFPPLQDPHRPPRSEGPERRMPVMQKGSLGHIVQTFKAAVSRQVVSAGLSPRGVPIWQRGYYEHIIRDNTEHDRIAQYIAENPENWANDEMHVPHLA